MPGSWLHVREADGVFAGLLDDPCFCNCDEYPDQCGVCAADCAVPTAPSMTIPAGGARTMTWHGTLWQIAYGPDDGACQQPEDLATGTPMVAEFCYSTSLVDTTGGPSYLDDVVCQPVSFDVETQTVEQVVTDDDVPGTITFDLVNDTGGPIYTYYGNPNDAYDCAQDWMSLTDGAGHQLRLADACSICTCTDVTEPRGGCFGACPDVACPAPDPSQFRLADGERRSFVFDGTAWVDDSVAGNACERNIPVLDGPLNATYCWSTEADPTSGFPVDMTCMNATVDRSRSHVEFVVQ